jgi:hypothetical protein
MGRSPAAAVGAALGRVVGRAAWIEVAVVFRLAPHSVHGVAGEGLLNLVSAEFLFFAGGRARGQAGGKRGGEQQA